MKEHFSNIGHLPKVCYEEVCKIEYIELPSKIDMDIKELYYINTWKPKYNTADKQEGNLSLKLSSDNWLELIFDKKSLFTNEKSKKLKDFFNDIILNLKNDNKNLKAEIKKFKKERNKSFRQFQKCIIEELSERNELERTVKKQEKLIKFYEFKTEGKYKYLYDYIYRDK